MELVTTNRLTTAVSTKETNNEPITFC